MSALNGMRSRSTPAYPVPVARCQDCETQILAAIAICNATLSDEAVPVLFNAFKDKDSEMRAFLTIIRDVTLSAEAVAAVLIALKDENAEVRSRAVSALRNATQFPEVVPALLDALKDENAEVHANAADALRNVIQNRRFRPQRNLSEKLMESMSLPRLDDDTRHYIEVNNEYQFYSALDCLFDALLAVAEYPEVK